MTVGKAIYYLLTNSTDVTDIVSTRVYPEIAEQNAALPYVVYNIANNEPTDTKPEPSKLDTAQIEVNVYSESYTECIDLSVAVRAALDRVKGTYNGVNVQSIQYVNEIIDFDEPQRAYNIAADYDVRISRSDFEIAQGSPITGVTLGELNDVSISLPSDGEVLIYSGGEFVNDNIAISSVTGLQSELDGIPDSIFDLNDVGQSGGSIAANSTLKYIDGQWTNSAPEAPTPVYDELSDLTDTTITTPTDNQFLRYNGTKWVNETVVQYHGRFDSEAETLLDGATATVELYYTAQADGDGLHEDAQSDTATSGYDIQRKLYYSEAAQADPDTGTWIQFTAIADNTSYASAKSTLLDYLKARTGGTVPISLKMTWEEVAQAPAFTGLLNESYGSGAAAAYGTRRLNGNYTGACMTIRRASDGTTTTIGFVGEEIDESAITTFCTGTTCTVQVWHDQSQSGGTGSGNDATAPTTAAQPTIYTGGALVKEGGRLALDFDGSSNVLVAGNIITTTNAAFAVVGSSDDISGNNGLFTALDASNDGYEIRLTSNALLWAVNSTDITKSITQFTQFLAFANHDGSTSSFSIDGNNSTTAASQSVSITANLKIGQRTAEYWDGKIQEAIAFDEDKSTDRTSIEGNISGYYQSAKLLDEAYGSGAEAAYSVRQLKRDNTECMVIRRASDSTITTIGFDSNGNIDEAAINTFCSGTTCTVYQWLDQSGNGNTATASAQANEPTIYTGGAIVKENGKVAVSFDGSNDGFPLDTTSLDIGSLSSFTTGKFNATSGSGMMLGLSGGGSNKRWYAPYLANTNFNFGYANSGTAVNTGADTNRHLFTMIAGTTLNSMQAWASSATVGTATLTTGIDSTKNGIGNLSATLYANCNVQESIFYTSDKSTDRTSIESNIGDYFTQNTPLLDTYTGAAAAYSLRKLSSSYSGSAIRVRRASDNTESDIGFNVFGELSTVELAAFCGSSDGFVKTWYCQSGNANDATQTATGSQPKIYDGTTGVVTENGKPAVQFDGSNDNFILSLTSSASNYSLFTAQKTTSTTSFFFDSQTGRLVFNGQPSNQGIYYDGSWRGSTHSINAQQVESILAVSPSSGQSYVNGSQINTGLSYTQTAIGGTTRLGSNYNAAGFFFAGTLQEFVLYNSDQSSNRTNIEDNINTFYSIY